MQRGKMLAHAFERNGGDEMRESYEKGDFVVFINSELHNTLSGDYPPFGTIGTIIDVFNSGYWIHWTDGRYSLISWLDTGCVRKLNKEGDE